MLHQPRPFCHITVSGLTNTPLNSNRFSRKACARILSLSCMEKNSSSIGRGCFSPIHFPSRWIRLILKSFCPDRILMASVTIAFSSTLLVPESGSKHSLSPKDKRFRSLPTTCAQTSGNPGPAFSASNSASLRAMPFCAPLRSSYFRSCRLATRIRSSILFHAHTLHSH